MWCVIWKRNELFEMFTNVIFESEKKALEFLNQQKSFRKKHEAKAVKYHLKYFSGVNEKKILA